jgi:hypothetical protein
MEFSMGKLNELVTWPRVLNVRLSRAAKAMQLDNSLGYPQLGQRRWMRRVLLVV